VFTPVAASAPVKSGAHVVEIVALSVANVTDLR
jgi:hypothetical protein